MRTWSPRAPTQKRKSPAATQSAPFQEGAPTARDNSRRRYQSKAMEKSGTIQPWAMSSRGSRKTKAIQASTPRDMEWRAANETAAQRSCATRSLPCPVRSVKLERKSAIFAIRTPWQGP